MQNFLKSLDRLAGIEAENNFARWLERIAFIFLILMVLSAPHSIAATQTAWLLGMLFWALRLFVKPRPKFVRTPLDIALWSFFGWSVITSIFSYAPDISIGKLRNTALFLIFYFVINNLRSIRAVKFLAAALIFSCMANVLWLPIERIYGRGVQISGVQPNSIFTKAIEFNHDVYLSAKGGDPRLFDKTRPDEGKPLPIEENDVILRANVANIRTPEELVAEIEKNDITYLENFHNPLYLSLKVRRADLLDGATALEKLGISSWKHNRNWRYAGFYGQIITYAEVLQMIISLVFGLFIAALGIRKYSDEKNEESFFNRNKATDSIAETRRSSSKISDYLPLLIHAFCLATMGLALLMTVTRAAQIAFLLSVLTVVIASGNRKLLAALAILIFPVALAGYFFIQQNRTIDVDGKVDPSVNYRQTVYREGFNLWTSSARNFLLGVGMDSVKRFKEEWHLYDNGKLEPSHFHSTPLQLSVERGLPALLLWFWILWIYGKILIKSQRLPAEIQTSETNLQKPFDWQTRGILLGCLGGLIGFFVSSLINYSLGDGEVAMVFYLLMGIGVALAMQISSFNTQNQSKIG